MDNPSEIVGLTRLNSVQAELESPAVAAARLVAAVVPVWRAARIRLDEALCCE